MEIESNNLNKVEGYIDDIFHPEKNTFKKNSECELCNLTKRTEWLYDDENWVICKCKTCHRWMAVYRKHTMFIPINYLIKITEVIRKIFGETIKLRMKQRSIKNHFHFHIYTKK